jgi:phage tail-like protein
MLRHHLGLGWIVAVGSLASVAPGLATPATGGGPLVAFHYGLDFPGALTGYFSTCSGLGSESKAERAREERGGRERAKVKFVDLVCTRGITSNRDLWNWRKQVEQGEPAQKDGTLTVYDETLHVVAQWQLTQAWPREVSLGDDGTERISIQYDEETRVK